MNYRMIMTTVGWVLSFEGLCMVLPLICALYYGEKEFFTFTSCIILCLAAGLVLVAFRPKNKTMYSRDGFVSVALSWVALGIFGAMPFLFSGTIGNFIDALFETVSGFTTTGSSILTDVEIVPKSILFWRSFTHWLGGMGVLVLLVAVLPLFGGGNLQLMKAESPGPSVGKLVPKVKSTAKILYAIYTGMTILQIILLIAGDMSPFDAMTTAFGTAGTGGFGIKNDSMGGYSPYIQNVCTVFMILFGIDFSLYYMLLMRRFMSVLKSEELRTYLIIIFTAITLICINCRHLFATAGETIRHSAFQVGSVITTTGYSSTDFDLWPQFSKTILLILMFVGACAGSTGGGMKVCRIVIITKTIVKQIRLIAHPKLTQKITMNGRPVEHETLRSINVFCIAYMVIFMLSVLIISLDDLGFTSNFSAVAATLNNIGPGFEKVGPMQNFSVYSPLSTFVLTVDMLIGRLEIFPMLMLLSPSTWRKG